MTPYKNCSGNSGVVAYESGSDFIKVKFVEGAVYLYTYKSAGKTLIEQMKKLAVAGKGLSSFISSNVRDRFESKSG